MKIIKAREVPDIDDNDEVIGHEVVVEVDIDGVITTVGGIDPKLSKQGILSYLESIKDEIIARAKGNAEYKTIERMELVTEQPRNLEVEVDALKRRVISLEKNKLTT